MQIDPKREGLVTNFLTKVSSGQDQSIIWIKCDEETVFFMLPSSGQMPLTDVTWLLARENRAQFIEAVGKVSKSSCKYF